MRYRYRVGALLFLLAVITYQRELSNMRSGRTHIFDQQHVIAVFTVNKFIDQFFCQQKPEAAWPETLSFANS